MNTTNNLVIVYIKNVGIKEEFILVLLLVTQKSNVLD